MSQGLISIIEKDLGSCLQQINQIKKEDNYSTGNGLIQEIQCHQKLDVKLADPQDPIYLDENKPLDQIIFFWEQTDNILEQYQLQLSKEEQNEEKKIIQIEQRSLLEVENQMDDEEFVQSILNLSDIQDSSSGGKIHFNKQANRQFACYKNFLKPKPGRPKSKTIVSSKLTQFWRDIKRPFQLYLQSLIKKNGQLVGKMKQIFEQTKKGRKRKEEMWYINLIERHKQFVPYLLQLLDKNVFEEMIEQKTLVLKEYYKNNRIPVLIYVCRSLNYSEFKQFRDYYHLYKKSQEPQ